MTQPTEADLAAIPMALDVHGGDEEAVARDLLVDYPDLGYETALALVRRHR